MLPCKENCIVFPMCYARAQTRPLAIYKIISNCSAIQKYLGVTDLGNFWFSSNLGATFGPRINEVVDLFKVQRKFIKRIQPYG